MLSILCFLWWIVLGALLGWLASWLLGRGGRREPQVVERFVDRPVDNPDHLGKIATLEREVARLAAIGPTTIERIVDRPVEKLVDNPAHLARIRALEADIDALRAAPSRTIEKLVDNPAHLARIRTLETETARMADLETEIRALKAAPPKTIEKIVEKPVERVVERIVPDRATLDERDRQIAALKSRHDLLEAEIARLKRPPEIDLAAARAAGFAIKGPDEIEIIEGIGPKIGDLFRAHGLGSFAAIAAKSPAALKSVLDQGGLQFSVANPGTWPEQADLAARNRWTQLKALQDELVAGVRVARTGAADPEAKDLRAQLLLREAELKRLREPAPFDMAAAKAAGFSVKGPDDLEVIEGIGPKIAELLRKEGVATFARLAAMTGAEIKPMLERAGPNFRLADPETWPDQADLAARGRWRSLALLQKSLDGGKRQEV